MDLVDRFRVANLALALTATEAQIHSAAWGLPAMTWEEMLAAEFPDHAKPKPKPRPKPRPGC